MPRRTDRRAELQPVQDATSALQQRFAEDLTNLVLDTVADAVEGLLLEHLASPDPGWTPRADRGMIPSMPATGTRPRRSPEQRISDLQAQIAALKAKAERKKVQKDPALRSILAATKALDRALGASEDKALRQALGEARLTLASCLSVNGVVVPQGHGGPRKRRAAGSSPVAPDELLPYLRQHPGQGAASIATALGTDAATLRGPIKQLIAAGEVRAEGRARATRYWVR